MKIYNEIYDTLKKLALGYTDYEIHEVYIAKSLVQDKQNDELGILDEVKTEKRKRGRPKKNSGSEKHYVVEDWSEISDWGEEETRLVCVKRDAVRKVHAPEVAAIKMLIELEKENSSASDLELLADQIIGLSKDELISLRADLLTRDLTKD